MAHPESGLKGQLNGVPTWAKILAYLILTVGIPPLVIFYFLARDAGWINSPLLQTSRATAEIVQKLENHDKRTVAFIEAFKLSQRVACQNAAFLPSGQVDFARRANCENIR